MELNKNGRNFLLGTLFKSYLVQTAVCSLIIWVCTGDGRCSFSDIS